MTAKALARIVPKTFSYGTDPQEQLDVYAPTVPKGSPPLKNAPVLFVVHGGGWRNGDKAYPQVVKNKVACWCPRGWIVISINYPLGVDTDPRVDPYTMAVSCAKALAFAQGKAASWGGDPNRFMLMAHSAGAHLASLDLTALELMRNAGARPVMGAVLLDSAAYDVEDLMNDPRHNELYDIAFQDKPLYWKKVSPQARMRSKLCPLLIVYSEQRGEGDMDHAVAFFEKAKGFGTDATLLPVDLPHGELNSLLGEEPLSKYSQDVITWMDAHKRG